MLNNTNITQLKKIISPSQLKSNYPLDEKNEIKIKNYREVISSIIKHNDKRFLVIVGPCSIHNINAAKEYAQHFKKWQQLFSDKIFLIMRVYFEKPRTTIGWKGYINDPDLNNKFNINKGLIEARQLMLYLTSINIPIACEFLDVFIPQYIGDLVSWGCIGARTCESQLHRQLASGLSMPVGFKNPTSGSIEIAIESMISSSYPHVFLGIDDDGKTSFIETTGNKHTHIVLRGERTRSNYSIEDIIWTENLLKNNKRLNNSIIIDCSHDNCRKDYKKQELVFNEILKHKFNKNKNIIGLMLESNIKEGSQKLTFPIDSNKLEYGKSITDGCIDINTTHNLLKKLYDKLSELYFFKLSTINIISNL